MKRLEGYILTGESKDTGDNRIIGIFLSEHLAKEMFSQIQFLYNNVRISKGEIYDE